MTPDRTPLSVAQRAGIRAVYRGRGGTVATRTMDVLQRRALVEWSPRTRTFTLTAAGEREHARITSGR